MECGPGTSGSKLSPWAVALQSLADVAQGQWWGCSSAVPGVPHINDLMESMVPLGFGRCGRWWCTVVRVGVCHAVQMPLEGWYRAPCIGTLGGCHGERVGCAGVAGAEGQWSGGASPTQGKGTPSGCALLAPPSVVPWCPFLTVPLTFCLCVWVWVWVCGCPLQGLALGRGASRQ